MTESAEPILQFFAYEHLPEKMQQVSRPFCELAKQVVDTLPRCAERTVALRKLLEGKDAAVRASIIQIAVPSPDAPQAPEAAPTVPA